MWCKTKQYRKIQINIKCNIERKKEDMQNLKKGYKSLKKEILRRKKVRICKEIKNENIENWRKKKDIHHSNKERNKEENNEWMSGWI